MTIASLPSMICGRARELALLICKSEEAIAAFLAYCDVAARDSLMRYVDVVIVLSTVLRIKRTLDGAEIDKISPTWRRARRWRLSVGGARIGEFGRWPPRAFWHKTITPMAHRCHILFKIGWTNSSVLGSLGRRMYPSAASKKPPKLTLRGLF
jgi:hypothetical protein